MLRICKINMKILWITNIILPEAAKSLNLPIPVIGGWMHGLSRQLANQKFINLAIASTYSGNNLIKSEINNITYFTIPSIYSKKYPKKLEHYWRIICSDFNPDIVHIHGTEHLRALACIRACPKLKYVISIQALNSTHSRYCLAGLKKIDIIKNITIRDLLFSDTLFQMQSNRTRKGIYDKEYVINSSIIVGRTNWDYAHIKAINRAVKYSFCNESLRDEFYSNKHWKIDSISRFTIFLSQSNVPLKGLHQLIKAVALIKHEYPLINIRVAGNNIIKMNTIKDRLKLKGYGKYIISLIKKYNLKGDIKFLGLLDSHKMILEYLNAHVFILPSSIENSPNSLGEAQIIGTPVIASYVGGVPDMVTHNKTGLLYRFDEYEMLADNIVKLFENDELANHLSQNGIKAAEKRHNREMNLKRLINIYNSI